MTWPLASALVMIGMRTVAPLALTLALAGGTAAAQGSTTSPEQAGWSLDASAYTYIVPDSRNYVQPTVAADRDRLHLEARFNYEDRDTGSVWVGYNVSAGDEITLEVTPLVGVVFGNTAGIAPGYRLSLRWRIIDFSSEAEYVVDAGESADSFLYTWSELALAPTAWSRFGLAVQRTKVYQSEFDIQRGVFAGFSYQRAELAAYVFNPDASPTVVLAVTVGF